MCGIAGFTGERDDVLLEAMNTCIAHRGPDDADQFVCDDVSLAYRRLAIIDRATGDQPIFNEDESVVIVYNGETYNYRDLRARLEPSHTFRTNSDTETIVHLYEELGPAGFRELNGMFAFALWDGRSRKLYLVRDRFGIKPLFYAERDGRLFFASEIKALLRAIPPKPNDAQIYQYLMYRIHDHNENTFFAGIQRLLPGTYLEWQEGQSRLRRYWEPDLTSRAGAESEAELAEQFEKLFVQAVRRQLVSEVPVGSCLSGGLDSSSIVAVINSLMRQHIPEQEVIGDRQKTFSAMFPGEANDETEYIRALTSRLPVEEHAVYPSKSRMFDELEHVVYHQDEPFVTTAIFAQWEVMKEASRHVTVTLDGQGADELLAGYFPYYVVYLRQLIKERRYWTALKELVLSADVLISWSIEPLKERLRLARTVDPRRMLNPSWVRRAKTPPPRPSCRDNLNQRLWEDVSVYSLPALLRYGDRNSMAFSVESRVPFLDNDLVDFILSLPPEYKIRNGWNKRIMRRALGKYLPAKIRNRRWKVGFTTPEVAWMRAERKRVMQIFNSQSFRSRGYFNADRVIEEFQAFVDGKTNNSFVFWRLLNLELWFRVFFDGDVNERSGVLAGKPRQVADS